MGWSGREDGRRESRDRGRGGFHVGLHRFRAFAIVNIMLAHIWYVPSPFEGEPGVATAGLVREILFHDSTMYFLFVSGFLARHLAGRTTVVGYYRKKLLHVVLPYALFTLLFVVFVIPDGKSGGTGPFGPRLLGALLRGEACWPYWYIPFVVPIFVATPLLLAIPSRAFSALALVAAFLPLLGTRTGVSITVGQYAYLAPVYVLGMHAAAEWPRTRARLDRARWGSFAVAVAATALLAWSGPESRPAGFVDLTESLFYVQKLALCLWLVAVFTRHENRRMPLVDLVATASFGLYFVHYPVAYNGLTGGLYARVLETFPAATVPVSLVYAVAVGAASLGLVVVAKRGLGRWSRYLIGS